MSFSTLNYKINVVMKNFFAVTVLLGIRHITNEVRTFIMPSK